MHTLSQPQATKPSGIPGPSAGACSNRLCQTERACLADCPAGPCRLQQEQWHGEARWQALMEADRRQWMLPPESTAVTCGTGWALKGFAAGSKAMIHSCFEE